MTTLTATIPAPEPAPQADVTDLFDLLDKLRDIDLALLGASVERQRHDERCHKLCAASYQVRDAEANLLDRRLEVMAQIEMLRLALGIAPHSVLSIAGVA